MQNSKDKVLECIKKTLREEDIYLRSKAEELKKNGVVVINVRLMGLYASRFLTNTNWLEEMKTAQLADFKTREPEYGFVLGAFGALGNPASFHNVDLYKLRYHLFLKYKKLFNYIDNTRYLEVLFDRLCIRRQGTTTSKETFHRDTCSLKTAEDIIYGGWINLDKTTTQYFSCVPGTHNCAGKGGFEKLEKEEADKAKTMKVKYTINPFDMVIFDQNTVHEIFPQTQKKDNIRLYLGWRHTKSTEPLFNSRRDERFNINQILAKQLVPPLPSGDLPTMYSGNHPGLWRDRIVTLTSEIKPFYTIINDKYKNGVVVMKKIKDPIALIEIPNIYKTIYRCNITT